MFKQSKCLIKAAARRSSLPSNRCCSPPHHHHHHHHQATGYRMAFRHLSSPAFQEVKESIPDDVLKTKRKEILSGVIELNKQRKKNLTELKKNEEEITVTKEKDELSSSPTHLNYVGSEKLPITSHLHIVKPDEDTPSGLWPVFRLMDENGTWRDGTTDGFVGTESSNKAGPTTLTIPRDGQTKHDLDDLRDDLKVKYPFAKNEVDANGLFFPSQHKFSDTDSKNTLLRAWRHMVRLREMDSILQNAQRQGRISFYMTCHGEEAIHIGSASALELRDTVLAQYREAGLLMWRGFTLEQFTDQCFSNKADLGKGRQMPVHYGSKALNYQTISSPLGTQIPQATGAAYRLKLQKKDAIAVCFFGDGCASTTDFHSGLSFAAVLNAPVVFFCRNNGYAISTPITDQYSGDGIISRAKGYGMAGIRVDGNDIFAVHAAVREARKYALDHNEPVLIEAMSYRQGHHSTSDDSLRYRSAAELNLASQSDPLVRLQNFLQTTCNMSESDFTDARDEEKIAVLKAMQEAEQKPDPPLEELFNDVYFELPQSLQEQQQQLLNHISKYPKQY